MQVEVSENWLTAGTIIGMFAFGALGAFSKLYMKSREDERTAAASSPAIAGKAVGAAFVDRASADALVGIAEDVSKIRELAEERRAQDDKKTILEEAARVAREEAAKINRGHGHHRTEDDD